MDPQPNDAGGRRLSKQRPPVFAFSGPFPWETVERRALSEKSIANILGTIRTMFGDAHFNEVIAGNPYALPRKTLKRKSKERAPYNGREVLALLSDRVDVTRRCFSGSRSSRA